MDSLELLKALLGLPEGVTFDAKRAGDNEKKLRAIVAFANTEGGMLALGLEDPSKAEGMDRVHGIQENEPSVAELQRMVRQRVTPPLMGFDGSAVEFREVSCLLRDGKRGSIVLVNVAKSRRVHSIMDGGTYARVGSTNRQLTAEEIVELSLRRGERSWTEVPADVEVSLLDTPWWRQYATQRGLRRPFEEALQHLGLAVLTPAGPKPTRAAVLLFAESPAGLLNRKCAVRVFQYRGDRVDHSASTNLLRPPRTIDGPLIRVIREAQSLVLESLAEGIHVGPLGFEIVHSYPVRVLREAITNAVIHRDYRIDADIHVRIFDGRIEIESPGSFPADITSANVFYKGSRPRNRALVDHLREFPDPPNLDAGEGVPMMKATMESARLYPPVFLAPPEWDREAVVCACFNESRASIWDEVSEYLQSHADIGNPEVRKLLRSDDPVRASRQLKAWVDKGLLVAVDPAGPKAKRRYRRPGGLMGPGLFAEAP